MFVQDIALDYKKNGINPELILNFQKIIWDFYKSHLRELPWRNVENPYNIFVSEMMLQQTQAERVVEKYNKFLKRFPDFKTLAESSINDVLELWQGLGYNRRAIWLKNIAESIHNDYNDILPEDPIVLESFKGIGHATAREISMFAYNKRCYTFIETNIRRVYIYFFFPNREDVNDKEILKLVEQTSDDSNPREWFYALMDYGVMLKKKFPKKNPNLRSKNYKKQSKFKGSNRELRGKILKIILKNKKLKEKELFSQLNGYSQENIKENLTQMQKEGFIKIEEDSILIA